MSFSPLRTQGESQKESQGDKELRCVFAEDGGRCIRQASARE